MREIKVPQKNIWYRFISAYSILFTSLSTREKVLRLKPVIDEHVVLIRELAASVEVGPSLHTAPYLSVSFSLCTGDKLAR